jgi:hypothetical protein
VVRISVKTPQSTVSANKTIVVLSEDKKFLDKFSIWPDPFTAASGTDNIIFNWSTLAAGETGDVIIRMYNIAGELVKEARTTIQAGSYTWNLRALTNEHMSRGVYICVLYAKNSQGYTETKVTKFAITSYK